MKQLLELTPEKFQEIYTNEQFRNQVATAHSCCDKGGVHKFWKTCSYPIEYVVTEVQKAFAKEECQRAKKQAIKDNKGKLMFVGMGCTYDERYPDDVCNHRIRTEFVNSKGHKFFIEFGTGNKDQMRIDHAVDRVMENEYGEKVNDLYKKLEPVERYSKQWYAIKDEIKTYQGQPYYNYKGLEHMKDMPQYTKANVLEIVNSYFDCKFSEIVIDNYNVSTDDYTSVSPKKDKQPILF